MATPSVHHRGGFGTAISPLQARKLKRHLESNANRFVWFTANTTRSKTLDELRADPWYDLFVKLMWIAHRSVTPILIDGPFNSILWADDDFRSQLSQLNLKRVILDLCMYDGRCRGRTVVWSDVKHLDTLALRCQQFDGRCSRTGLTHRGRCDGSDFAGFVDAVNGHLAQYVVHGHALAEHFM